MNRAQKFIIAVIIPVIALFSAYVLSDSIFDEKCPYEEQVAIEPGSLTNCQLYTLEYGLQDYSANDFDKTWPIWLFVIIGTAGAELYLYKDRK